MDSICSEPTAYRGYHETAVGQEDAELTHVSPGTPGGEYLRRFWHAVALSSEVGELPVRLRVLAEDLVLFRDLSGRIGLLHRHCAHRQASLEYGTPCTRGIRCCYHGWLFDVDGTILETPGEPADSKAAERLRRTVRQGAYPAFEYKGLIFAYLGPPERLLDEPFSALDPLIRRQLQDQFLDLSRTLRKTTMFITHDLDEAIRLGDRIAIMKDGRIVQVGTPEDIVTQPVDAYVAEFVRGLSKLKLVHARSVMQPMDSYLAGRDGGALDGCPIAGPDADLDTLIDLVGDGEKPIVIAQDDTGPIGVVTLRSLLRGIQGAK